jgi:hypothetical protein
MGFSTKEKSSQKRKGINNQNNFSKLFPVINTTSSSSLFYILINIIFTFNLSQRWDNNL